METNVWDTMIQLKPLIEEFLESVCIINEDVYPLDTIEQMGYDKFSLCAKKYMPLRLYKYFSNITIKDETNKEGINYSQQALLSNEVYLNAPNQFDDVYDSEISIPWDEYYLQRIKVYAEWCGISVNNDATAEQLSFTLAQKMYDAFLSGQDVLDIFRPDALRQGQARSIEEFIRTTQTIALKEQTDLHTALFKALHDEYTTLVHDIQNSLRISCFATTPFSQLMWGGSSADNHRGFCLEYTIFPNDPQYGDVYNNLFPVVYSKTRTEPKEQMMSFMDADLTKETLWNLYFHGTLRKSIDWAYQNEWRLLLPSKKNQKGFTVPFVPITKVFLGNRMVHSERSAIIDVCHQKNIPYTGVTRAIDRFEMQECTMLCEKCLNYINAVHL